MPPVSPMSDALIAATHPAAREEVPIGAIIVNEEGRIIANAYNEVEARQDASAHAELLAIRRACEARGGKFLEGCDMYVTLEPCPMCAGAISLARLRRLYFGAYDPKSGGVEHGPRVFTHPTCHHKPEVYGGIMEAECSALLKDFFLRRR